MNTPTNAKENLNNFQLPYLAFIKPELKSLKLAQPVSSSAELVTGCCSHAVGVVSMATAESIGTSSKLLGQATEIETNEYRINIEMCPLQL